jgi:hypothetical protein
MVPVGVLGLEEACSNLGADAVRVGRDLKKQVNQGLSSLGRSPH